MKCDELKAFDVGLGQYCEDGSPCVVAFDADKNPRLLNEKVYLKSDVDATIAELKSTYKESVEVKVKIWERCKKAEDELRKTQCALWLARADRAIMTLDYFTLKCRWFKDYMKVEPPKCDVKMIHKWANIERKCRAKKEEYK